MTQNSDILQQDLSGGVLRLTLCDPSRRNALSSSMLEALGAAIISAGSRADVRVIVIAGEGPAFSSGHDLKEITAARDNSDDGRAAYAELMKSCSEVMMAITECPKPVIAEVAGVATAAGCQLVASCDLAIAGESARFATPGVNIGLFCSTPMVAVSRAVSRKHALEMLLTGQMISAARADEIGLINKVVTDEALTAEVNTLADTIASKSSYTISLGKQAFQAQSGLPLSEAYALTSGVMVENLLAHDAEEGIGAFLEKRDPNWRDR